MIAIFHAIGYFQPQVSVKSTYLAVAWLVELCARVKYQRRKIPNVLLRRQCHKATPTACIYRRMSLFWSITYPSLSYAFVLFASVLFFVDHLYAHGYCAHGSAV
jgi:hypothetical protein